MIEVCAAPPPTTGPTILLGAVERADLALIASGAAAPLTGFLGAADHRRVLAEQRLTSGAPWPVPFVLPVPDRDVEAIRAAGTATLQDLEGRTIGTVRITDIHRRDPIAEVRALYGTDDANHPGVAAVLARPRWVAGGEVEVLERPAEPLRAQLAERGWRTVAGFFARGASEAVVEQVVRAALERCDGLVLHPALAARASDRVLPAALPGVARHAGPREALLDALIGKNLGIDTPVVVRDRLAELDGGPDVFARFGDELGVTPLRVEPVSAWVLGARAVHAPAIAGGAP